jgi:hypothetical protein
MRRGGLVTTFRDSVTSDTQLVSCASKLWLCFPPSGDSFVMTAAVQAFEVWVQAFEVCMGFRRE